MIVLHAGFSSSLLLWGETSEIAPPAGKRRKDQLIASFACDAEALLEVAKELGVAARKSDTCETVAWLPATGEGPVQSTALLGDDAAISGRTYLSPWIVNALPLRGPHSASLLAACTGQPLLRAGLLAGADLRYWAAAMRFTAGLVMRGQFLPGAAEEGMRARWRPVIAGPDAMRFEALASAMPPSARALAQEAEDEPPSCSSATVLRQFVDAMTDTLVRDSVVERKWGDFENTHDRWLHALASSDGALGADAKEAASLTSQIDQWQRPIQVSASAPFRLSFRLEEPEEDSMAWMVRYLLQGNRDPSLLLPANDAWSLKQRAASVLGIDAGRVREHLLASLGQAAGIYAPIESSLRERNPEGCEIDLAGAHRFLKETAAALEQSGFGVMLPAWWTRSGSEVRLQAKAKVKSPKMQGGSGISMESLVDFNWEMALGGDTVSRAELEALARMKAPLVKLRGQWVEVNSREIQAAIEFLNRKHAQAVSLGDVVRMSLGAGPEGMALEIAGVEATGWIADLLAQLEGSVPFEELPAPEGLLATLRPYQRRGYSWLRFLQRWGLGACLADDMGLGKTVQALALIQHERRAGAGPVLLVRPTSVVGNWQKEAARFTPELPVLVHHGIGRHKGPAFEREASRHAIVLSSYALLHRDAEALSKVGWSGVILDEAQNIKNQETKQARAARGIAAGWRIALTGTPVENNVGDLWSLMEFLNPGFLGGQSSFKKRFFVPIQVYGSQDAAERLKRITGPFILRRLKTDKRVIADLPDKLEMKVFCTLTKEQASLYAAVVKDAEEALEKAEGMARRGLVLATLTKLKQVCNHPAQFLKDRSAIEGRSGKLARLTEMVEETLAVGDRSLIFTQFTEMGEIVRRHLQESLGGEVLFLHGGTTKKGRDQMVERFSGDGGPPIFLLSLKAGGTGLNLTRANHVFHFDRWWNPAVENQATDRAFRIGQTRNVQVHKFLCAGTLEERIDEMIERKKEVAGKVVGTGEGWLTELSNSELKSLFALRKEAVGE